MHRFIQRLLPGVVLASVFTVGLALPASAQVKEPVWVWNENDMEFGPKVWGEIEKSDGTKRFPFCSGGPKGQGSKQTPINIMDPKASELPDLVIRYGEIPLHVVNNFREIQVRNGNSKNKIVIDGESFWLDQLHFHIPSEHAVGGERAAMEAHFVHDNGFGQIAVLGVLYQLGRKNSELEKIFDHAPRDNGTYLAGEKVIEGRSLNALGLLPAGKVEYFHYSPGSLTTPPCAKELLWFVLKKPATVSQKQLDTYTQILRDVQEGFPTNARPIQNLEGREILEIKGGQVIFPKNKKYGHAYDLPRKYERRR